MTFASYITQFIFFFHPRTYPFAQHILKGSKVAIKKYGLLTGCCFCAAIYMYLLPFIYLKSFHAVNNTIIHLENITLSKYGPGSIYTSENNIIQL